MTLDSEDEGDEGESRILREMGDVVPLLQLVAKESTVEGTVRLQYQEVRKDRATQIEQFITDYVENHGRVLEKYCSKKNYISPEWQAITNLLDRIAKKAQGKPTEKQ